MARILSVEQRTKLVQLKAQGCTHEEAAALIGCSIESVTKFWRTLLTGPDALQPPPLSKEPSPLPADVDPKSLPKDAFDKYKLQLAARSLQTASALVRSIEDMRKDQLDKIPLHQRAIAAGILMDKFKQLTQPDPQAVLEQAADLFSVLLQSVPTRKKDAIVVEDVEPIDE